MSDAVAQEVEDLDEWAALCEEFPHVDQQFDRDPDLGITTLIVAGDGRSWVIPAWRLNELRREAHENEADQRAIERDWR